MAIELAIGMGAMALTKMSYDYLTADRKPGQNPTPQMYVAPQPKPPHKDLPAYLVGDPIKEEQDNEANRRHTLHIVQKERELQGAVRMVLDRLAK
jgi:hypothetical protein